LASPQRVARAAPGARAHRHSALRAGTGTGLSRRAGAAGSSRRSGAGAGFDAHPAQIVASESASTRQPAVFKLLDIGIGPRPFLLCLLLDGCRAQRLVAGGALGGIEIGVRGRELRLERLLAPGAVGGRIACVVEMHAGDGAPPPSSSATTPASAAPAQNGDSRTPASPASCTIRQR
jgi:hypothetical protein